MATTFSALTVFAGLPVRDLESALVTRARAHRHGSAGTDAEPRSKPSTECRSLR